VKVSNFDYKDADDWKGLILVAVIVAGIITFIAVDKI
jgi:hypothetical protein